MLKVGRIILHHPAANLWRQRTACCDISKSTASYLPRHCNPWIHNQSPFQCLRCPQVAMYSRCVLVRNLSCFCRCPQSSCYMAKIHSAAASKAMPCRLSWRVLGRCSALRCRPSLPTWRLPKHLTTLTWCSISSLSSFSILADASNTVRTLYFAKLCRDYHPLILRMGILTTSSEVLLSFAVGLDMHRHKCEAAISKREYRSDNRPSWSELLSRRSNVLQEAAPKKKSVDAF